MSSADSSTALLPRKRQMLPLSPSFLWRAGAILAAAGITAGAFGAHGLKARPNITADQLQSWNLASNYAIFNGLGLLLLSSHPRFSTHRYAGPAILGGCFMFSGSIVALILWREKLRFLGPMTPMGGLLMISGYLALAM